jgi:hypothetical protein
MINCTRVQYIVGTICELLVLYCAVLEQETGYTRTYECTSYDIFEAEAGRLEGVHVFTTC